MNPLNLYVEHGGGVDVEVPHFLEVRSQRLLLLELHVQPLGLQRAPSAPQSRATITRWGVAWHLQLRIVTLGFQLPEQLHVKLPL